RRRARRPDGPQGAPPSLLAQVHRPDAREVAGQPAGDPPGGVDAGVVGDRDPPRQREPVGEVALQPPDGELEVGFLVVDGNDDLDVGHGVAHGRGLEAEKRVGAHGPRVGPAPPASLRRSWEFSRSTWAGIPRHSKGFAQSFLRMGVDPGRMTTTLTPAALPATPPLAPTDAAPGTPPAAPPPTPAAPAARPARQGDPTWVRPALVALLAATAVLYLWRLGAS